MRPSISTAIALLALLAGCGASAPNDVDATAPTDTVDDLPSPEDTAPDVVPEIQTTDTANDTIDNPWPTCPEYADQGPSLHQKAAFLDELVVKQHLPDELLRSVILDDDGQPARYLHLPSSGLWTAIYLASQSLRYAVTGDPAAQANAAVAVQGLHHLTAVTGVPGLYGRCYDRPGFEYGFDPDGAPSWVASTAPDHEGWYWNDDVSKDTMDGIMFGYAVALEHLDDPDILATIRADSAAFVDYLVTNDLTIVDHTGEVTEHGHMLYSAVDDLPGFNALLTTSWIRTVLTETEDPDMQHFYYDCLMRQGDRTDCPDIDFADLGSYMDAIEKFLGLYRPDCMTNYDDIDMTFQAIYPMIRRETDPDLLARLLGVLDVGVWTASEPLNDAPPVSASTHSLYIFMYAALSNTPPTDPTLQAAMHDAVCTLYRLPQDRTDRDIAAGTQEPHCLNRHGEPNAKDIIPIEERYYDNYVWRLDPYTIPTEHKANPGLVHSPEDFLPTYWLGRYHGLLTTEM